MTHTPGPWKIDVVSPLGVIADNEDGNGICNIDGDETFPEIQANANLIAAAPDLLAALKLIERVAMGANGHGVMIQRILKIARANITKAESKS